MNNRYVVTIDTDIYGYGITSDRYVTKDPGKLVEHYVRSGVGAATALAPSALIGCRIEAVRDVDELLGDS